ncbi:hypothetical protein DID77_02290 [Candidatus Marinamargulisbacteria bacterium SCGC AG-439-L15]|nr:hypothetical protein DID77_02290 [Candidatus Marinamargulisbacteria bacterium SCGC AG-439-L15]
MKRNVIGCLIMGVVFLMAPVVMGQDYVSSLLFDEAEDSLIGGIENMNRRKAAIAYNIANGTTPGFRPVRFQDEIENAIRVYGDASVLDVVDIDDEMVKATTVRLRHSAYVKLLSTKMGITKKVVTLGKGGG